MKLNSHRININHTNISGDFMHSALEISDEGFLFLVDSKKPDMHSTPDTSEEGLKFLDSKKPDMVNHPAHYNKHPKGYEVIDVIAHMDFCLGNAVKYIMRAEHKDNQIQDLEKAVWYLNYKIKELKEKEL